MKYLGKKAICLAFGVISLYLCFFIIKLNGVSNWEEFRFSDVQFIFLYASFLSIFLDAHSRQYNMMTYVRYPSRKSVIGAHFVNSLLLHLLYLNVITIILLLCGAILQVGWTENTIEQLSTLYISTFMGGNLLICIALFIRYICKKPISSMGFVLSWLCAAAELLCIKYCVKYMSIPVIELMFSWMYYRNCVVGVIMMFLFSSIFVILTLRNCRDKDWDL